jgi:uncharacterized protein YlxW (UPF0749 family)
MKVAVERCRAGDTEGGQVTRAHQLGFALLLLFAGFLLVVQLRANQAFLSRSALPSRRLEDLTVLIRRQQESDRRLKDEVAELEAKREEYQAGAARGRSLAVTMQTELSQLREALGLTGVHGPGIRVVLEASSGQTSVPQAQDLADVANELWAAGAEAVAVNGVRLRATDGFLQHGGAVRVAGKVIRDPFTITGIGDPDALEGALLARGGLIDGLRGIGLNITVSRLRDVMLPPRSGADIFRVVRPSAPAK